MLRLFCLGALLACGLSSPALAASPEKSWPWFRGVDRSAVSQETGLLQEWPEGGPPLVWETKGAGRGYASFAIAEGRLYTLGDGLSTAEDQDEYLSCYDLNDGKQLWKGKTGPAWQEGQPNWQSSRSTPSVDGDRVYCVTPQGRLVCCDSATGAEKWAKDFKADFAGGKRRGEGDGWGYSESVLIDGERLICTPGKEKNTMVALDKLTGELIWSASRPGDNGAGHASVIISQVGGVKVYVNTTASGALGVRASDGKLLWSHADPQATAVIPTSIVREDLVFVVAGYGSGGTLLRQISTDDGVKVEPVYGLKRELKNKHGGVVLVGDYLYGDSDDRGRVYCAEFMTGNVNWTGESKLGKNSAAICAADGRLYCMYANGTMVLAKADPAEYQEVGSFRVGDAKRPHWSHPVVVGGRLYLRDQDRILCYDVKAK